LVFKRHCEDLTQSEKAGFPQPVAGAKLLAGAFGGKGGSAPDRRANAKIGRPRFAFASAKLTLIVRK
jgi:hypothetical protein